MRACLPSAIALLVGCAPAPPRSNAPPASPSKPPAAGDDAACVRAESIVAGAEAKLRKTSTAPLPRLSGCERAAVKAAGACTTIAKRAHAVLRSDAERLAAETTLETTMSNDERWILQVGSGGSARVFSRTDASVALSLRTDMNFPTLAGDDRLFAVEPKSAEHLVVVDLVTHDVARFDDVLAFRVIGADLYLAGATHVRRLSWPNLEPRGDVTTTVAIEPNANAFRAVGSAFVVGDALVSFDRGTVLASGLRFGAPSRDGARIAACDDKGTAKVIDTYDGQPLVSFDVSKTSICVWTIPALSPDGRTLVAVDDKDVNGTREMVAVAWDVATKKEVRREAKGTTFSTALDAEVEVEDAQPPRVCVDYGNMHWHTRDCPWVLDPSGTPNPPAKPKSPGKKAVSKGSWKNASDDSIAEATSPDGKVRVVATAHALAGEADDHDHLVLHVIDAASDAQLASAEIVAGAFYVTLHEHDGLSPPVLRFVDATHVLFDPRAPPLVMGVWTTTTGAWEPFDPDAKPLHGRFVLLDDVILDVLSHARLPLTTSAEEWIAAPEVTETCP